MVTHFVSKHEYKTYQIFLSQNCKFCKRKTKVYLKIVFTLYFSLTQVTLYQTESAHG